MKDDGGQVHPSYRWYTNPEATSEPPLTADRTPGITRRDALADRIAAALVSKIKVPADARMHAPAIAEDAYAIADAVIVEGRK